MKLVYVKSAFLMLMLYILCSHPIYGFEARFENFDSDPGWTGYFNTSGLNSYGYSSTNYAGGSTGEAGGKCVRESFYSYYGDDSIGILTLDDTIAGSGKWAATGESADGAVRIGHFNTGGGFAIGFYPADYGRIFLIFNDYYQQIGSTSLWSLGTPYTWDYIYDPNAGSFGELTVNFRSSGGSLLASGNYTLTQVERQSSSTYNAFGIYQPNGNNLVRYTINYIDDVIYALGEIIPPKPYFYADPLTKIYANPLEPYNETLSLDASHLLVGETLTFQKLSGPSWLYIDPNGIITGEPNLADTGLNEFQIKVIDSKSNEDTTTLQITVKDPAYIPSGTLLLSDSFDTSITEVNDDVNVELSARQAGIYADSSLISFESHADRCRLDPDGRLILRVRNPASITPANAGIVYNTDFSGYSTFQIDVDVDPVLIPGGYGNIFSGITVGLGSTSIHPSRWSDQSEPKICFSIKDETLRGRWYIFVDDNNVTTTTSYVQGVGMTNAYTRRDGFYHLRVIGTPKDGGTLLRFYIDNMVRPVQEYQLNRSLVPNYVGLFSRLGGTQNIIYETAFDDFSIKAIDTTSALWNSTPEEEVLYAINLDYPGLEAVKTAMQAGDIKTARTEYIDYMINRSLPIGAALKEEFYTGNYQEISNFSLESKYGTCGWYSCFVPHVDANGNIAWDQDTGYLNRHYHWCSLAKAYEVFGDEHYSKRFAYEVSDWVTREPFYQPNGAGGLDWIDGTKLEEGWRFTGNIGRRSQMTWWPSYEVFHTSPSFSYNHHIKMILGFIRQSRLLMNPSVFFEWDDSGVHGAIGLFHNATMLPEMQESQDWLDVAEQHLNATLAAQVHPDGSHVSLSTGYGWATVDGYQDYFDITSRNGLTMPQVFLDGIEALYMSYAKITRPYAFGLVTLNDGISSSKEDKFQDAVDLFPGNTDFPYFASNGAQGTEPNWLSQYLPNAGWFAMRTGWGNTDKYLFMDAGPFGASHGKQDKLHLVLDIGGAQLIRDSGREDYVYPETPDGYTGSTRAYNTILVDDLEQRRGANSSDSDGFTPEQRRWHSDENFDYAEGFFSDGWKGTSTVLGTQTRQVIFVKGDNPPDSAYWVVIDTIVPDDSNPHEYSAMFHLNTSDPVVDPVTKTVTASSHGLKIIPLNPDVTVDVVKGQTSPAYQGWFVSGGLAAVPTPIFKWTTTGPTVRAWALVVKRAGQADWPITSTSLLETSGQRIKAELYRPDGSKDIFARREVGAEPTNLASVGLTNDIGLLHTDATNNPINGLFIEIPTVTYTMTDLLNIASEWLSSNSYSQDNDMVVMEAEWFTSQSAGSGSGAGYDWSQQSDTGAFGSGYMHALPSDYVTITSNIETDSPRLRYSINFTIPQTYYLWVKGRGADADSDSLHYGLDGFCQTSGNALLLNAGSGFTWKSAILGGRPTVAINSSGLHHIDIWMRESGAEIDRVLLTTDSLYDPSLSEPPVGQWTSITMDLNGDGTVNMKDFAKLAEKWTSN